MSNRLAKRVMVIGWDAADWQFIEPLFEKGKLPHLKSLVDRGVMGKINTLSPILSPMLWNSIATGKLADKHGVLGFVEPDGHGFVRPTTSTSRTAKAIWNILSSQGMKSIVVSWFASHPAEKINGAIVTNRFQQSIGRDAAQFPLDASSVHPPELLDVISKLQLHPHELSDDQVGPFIPRMFEVNQETDARPAAVAKVIAEMASVHNAATYLLENQEWDLLAVYFDAIDHMGHGFMEYHPPAMSHVEPRDAEIYGGVMTATYQLQDLMLGRLIELAGPETTFIVLSDHGFHSGSLRPELEKVPDKPGFLTGRGVEPLAWHRQQGIFAAAGPGIKKDELVHGASLLDITPTVLALLGVSLGKDMDGKPLVQIFDRNVEPVYIDSHEPPHPNDGVNRSDFTDDPYEAHKALQQLVDLGYIAPIDEDKTKAVRQAVFSNRNVLAQVYYSTGRPAKSAETLREILREHDFSSIRARLAMCLIDMRQLDEAEKILDGLQPEAIDIPFVLVLRGQLYFARNDYNRAFECFEKALAADPTAPQAHVYLGKVHLKQERWQMAEDAFRRALEMDDDDAEAHDGLGIALYGKGDYEASLVEHMKSVSLDHSRAETHINLGMTLANLKQYDWAIRAFHVAIELAPFRPFPHFRLAELYARAKGDHDLSEKHAKLGHELRAKLTAGSAD